MFMFDRWLVFTRACQFLPCSQPGVSHVLMCPWHFRFTPWPETKCFVQFQSAVDWSKEANEHFKRIGHELDRNTTKFTVSASLQHAL
eukprot:2873634-Rhodomonas_salina.3